MTSPTHEGCSRRTPRRGRASPARWGEAVGWPGVLHGCGGLVLGAVCGEEEEGQAQNAGGRVWEMDEGCERKRNMIGGLNSHRGSNGVKCEQIFHPPRHRECTRVGNCSVNQNAKFKCWPMCRRSGQPGTALRRVLLRVCARMQRRLKRTHACNRMQRRLARAHATAADIARSNGWASLHSPTTRMHGSPPSSVEKNRRRKKRKYYMIYRRESPR